MLSDAVGLRTLHIAREFWAMALHDPVIQRAVDGFYDYYVGYDVLPPFIAWHVPYVSDSVRRGYLEQLNDYLGRLDELAPLTFPRMDQFDDRLLPIGARAP
jgi:hypothetical protein